jgi:hypothetical protein
MEPDILVERDENILKATLVRLSKTVSFTLSLSFPLDRRILKLKA